jgi:hypothetical protein
MTRQKPTIGLKFPKLVQDASARYGDLFANDCQRRQLAEYLTGLLVAPRKTASGIHDEFEPTTDQSGLNTTANPGVSDTGGSTITTPRSILVNSYASLSGSNTKLTASAIDVVKTASNSGGSSSSPTPTTGVTATADPLASLALPDTSSLTVQSSSRMTIKDNTTLNPGIYQGGLSIKNRAIVALNAGIYDLVVHPANPLIPGTAAIPGFRRRRCLRRLPRMIG